MFTSPHIKKQSRLATLLFLFCVTVLATSYPRIGRAIRWRALNQSPSSQASASQSPSQQEAKLHKAEFVPGELLVRFRAGAAAAKTVRAEMFIIESGRQIPIQVERLSEGPEIVEGLRLAHVAPDDTASAIEALRARPDVLYAEPNYILHASAIPNDPHFPELYGLKNTGSPSGFPGADIGAEQAWDMTTGSDSVVVGVVDTGIDIEHADLKENIWNNPNEIPDNGIDDDGDGYVDDVNGWDFYNNDKTVFDSSEVDAHGTHVAGTIGAAGNNGKGIVGVCWHVKLIPLKFIGSAQGAGPTSAAVSALQYAVAMRQKGVNIRAINGSWGGRDFSQALLDALKGLNSAGILFIAAAGNDGMDNDSFGFYPANYDVPNIISVGAKDLYGQRATFSNFGERTVRVYAPGVHILSATPRDYPGANYRDPDGATYSFFDGTSMAAAHVTGTAALICVANPSISLSQLRGSILFGGQIVSEQIVVSDQITKTYTYTNTKANSSLKSALENDLVPPGPITNPRVSSQLGRRIELTWTASGDDGSAGAGAALYDATFVDSSGGAEIPIQRLTPVSNGSNQQQSVSLPYQHTSGKINIVPFDNAGNAGASTSVDVAVDPIVANPYVPTESASSALSTGGILLNLQGDDKIFFNLALPFTFRFFGQLCPQVTVSTNGALYFFTPPSGTDALSTIAGLDNYSMIAGLWDDLRTDRRPGDGVYMVTPDSERVIFRWQAVTYDTPLGDGTTRGENPVNFEIELRRDNGIVIRYGEGNEKVRPVVGISGGQPDAYVVNTHTSETSLINLANAPAISFGLPPCTHSISSHGQSFPSGGGSGSIAVTTGFTCPWYVLNSQNWIHITYGSTGTGTGNMLFDVSANDSSSPRTATISVVRQSLADAQTFTITQDGITCHYQFGVNPMNFSAAGGSSSTAVFTSATCSWIARNNMPWVKITSGASGTGNGGIYLSVASNVSTVPRTGTISVGDATLTINQGAPSEFNPIDDARNFVHQHYLDFLSREPDQGGWDYWTGQITQCGLDALCIHNQRIVVSAAFFIELEFQQTGSVVYRMYRAAYGTMTNAPTRANVTYSQFIADRAQLVGGSGLPQSTINFANNFVARPEFKTLYPDAMTPTDFVNKLFDTANLTGPVNAALRQQQIDAMTSNGKTRAQVLLDVIELNEFKTREYNPSFVLMEYFGYLRRDPDQGGYDFWLNVLNNKLPNDPSGYRAMVCAFITSTEYQLRFGTSITRTNRDCSQ